MRNIVLIILSLKVQRKNRKWLETDLNACCWVLRGDWADTNILHHTTTTTTTTAVHYFKFSGTPVENRSVTPCKSQLNCVRCECGGFIKVLIKSLLDRFVFFTVSRVESVVRASQHGWGVVIILLRQKFINFRQLDGGANLETGPVLLLESNYRFLRIQYSWQPQIKLNKHIILTITDPSAQVKPSLIQRKYISVRFSFYLFYFR